MHVYDNAPYYITWYNPTQLNYRVDGGAVTSVTALSSGGQVFRGEIPGNLVGTIEYWFTSQDEYGNAGQSATLSYVANGGGANSGSAYCFGDGTGAACPCSNNGGTGEGCANSTGGGATLTGSGNASFSGDTLVLTVAGVNGNKPGLLLRGNNQVAIPAGDGILCAAGGSQRSQVQVTTAGGTVFTNFNGGAFGSVANAGGTPTNFQFWYRDPNPSGPCGTDFNFSNGWTVTYQP